jgi:succinyl-CoA synthetase beta subunit
VNIHEYQAKEILRALGVPIPAGEIATTADAARDIAARIGKTVVVKAQVHAGGRGKAGGSSLGSDERVRRRRQSSAYRLGPYRRRCSSLKRPTSPAAYVGVIMDRASRKPVFMVVRHGIDIEEVAAKTRRSSSRRYAHDCSRTRRCGWLFCI